MWISWLAWNALCFQAKRWADTKVEVLIWKAILDYVCVAWHKASIGLKWQPTRAPKILSRFDGIWYSSSLFCTCIDTVVTWNFWRPQLDLFWQSVFLFLLFYFLTFMKWLCFGSLFFFFSFLVFRLLRNGSNLLASLWPSCFSFAVNQ
jgi:hypothetical protein